MKFFCENKHCGNLYEIVEVRRAKIQIVDGKVICKEQICEVCKQKMKIIREAGYTIAMSKNADICRK